MTFHLDFHIVVAFFTEWSIKFSYPHRHRSKQCTPKWMKVLWEPFQKMLLLCSWQFPSIPEKISDYSPTLGYIAPNTNVIRDSLKWRILIPFVISLSYAPHLGVLLWHVPISYALVNNFTPCFRVRVYALNYVSQ